jgi:ankyrin repeat protein
VIGIGTQKITIYTPLFLAGHVQALKHLGRTHGVDVNPTTRFLLTPLHCAALQFTQTYFDMIQITLGKQHRKFITLPLFIHSLDIHTVIEITKEMIALGANVNQQDVHKRTPLHYASYSGNSVVVEQLLGAGADVDATDVDDLTPLHYAVAGKVPELIEILYRHGANMDNIKLLRFAVHSSQWYTDQNTEVIMLAAELMGIPLSNQAIGDGEPLLYWIINNHPENIVLTITTAVGDAMQHFGTNMTDPTLTTPLHLAVAKGYTRVARVLLQSNGNVNDMTC